MSEGWPWPLPVGLSMCRPPLPNERVTGWVRLKGIAAKIRWALVCLLLMGKVICRHVIHFSHFFSSFLLRRASSAQRHDEDIIILIDKEAAFLLEVLKAPQLHGSGDDFVLALS